MNLKKKNQKWNTHLNEAKFKKDISILPSNGTIFSQIENKISIKKRQNIFLESDYNHNKIDECLLTIEILSSSKNLIEIRKIPFFILH